MQSRFSRRYSSARLRIFLHSRRRFFHNWSLQVRTKPSYLWLPNYSRICKSSNWTFCSTWPNFEVIYSFQDCWSVISGYLRCRYSELVWLAQRWQNIYNSYSDYRVHYKCFIMQSRLFWRDLRTRFRILLHSRWWFFRDRSIQVCTSSCKVWLPNKSIICKSSSWTFCSARSSREKIYRW